MDIACPKAFPPDCEARVEAEKLQAAKSNDELLVRT